MLILTDNQCITLTCSEPIEGNHNNAFKLVPAAEQMLANLESSGIRTDGLFLNADSGFDTEDFRRYCFENEIIGNIDLNNRNGKINEYLFDDLLYNCINVDLLLKDNCLAG